MTQIPIILLAAGQSSRMGGQDKLLQIVDGQPLLRRAALIACQAAPVIVALPPAPHPRFKALEGLSLLRVEIPDANEGMNASLRGALAHVPPDAGAVMILLADLPDITTADLSDVLSAVQSHPDKLIWRGATASGKAGHPVAFDRSLFNQLSHLTGDKGAQSVVRAHADKVHLHALPGQNALLDLDTPADWTAWRAKRST
ncbi:molybdopterin-guanine dinucleotide biosynthesis protein A [Ruegeria denitrificans]|uniref:Molybdopterin-guanine dinucleotide biosynthesis protein A n=1 Tax=Ruegeria denitrificans TaxID=1715692 RepID=A0A0P1I6D0_9RHOB|nr:nucleotidyltransferase family protein [Ruegeria denitrificans]CUJ93040.1 molybdopterin-guanine dinucleotide biosynthesis protein A [Ruegeria denitrificans]